MSQHYSSKNSSKLGSNKQGLSNDAKLGDEEYKWIKTD